MKIHKSQMEKNEIDLLRTKLNKVDIASIEITSYTLHRFNQRFEHITLLDIARTFKSYDIIEFNTNSNDRRVLIRGLEDIPTSKGKYNVCIVYSILSNRIITAWLNNAKDNHETLRIEEYSKDLAISW